MAATAANMCGMEGFLLPDSSLGCCDSPDSCMAKPRVRFEITSVTDTPSGESEDEYDFDPDDVDEEGSDGDEEQDDGESRIAVAVGAQATCTTTAAERVAAGNAAVPEVENPSNCEVTKKLSELDIWRSRFRIVRISSSGPHKVGSWTVTDYYDNEVPALARAASLPPLAKSCSVPAFTALPPPPVPPANPLSAGVQPTSALPFAPVKQPLPAPVVKTLLAPRVSDPSAIEKRQNRLPEGVALESLARQVLGDSRRSSNDSGGQQPQQETAYGRESRSRSSSEENSSVSGVASKGNNSCDEKKAPKKCSRRCQYRHREVVVCRRKKYLTVGDVSRRAMAARLAAAGRPKKDDSATINGTALMLKASIEKELRAELESHLEHRLAELDRDVRLRSLTKRNVQLCTQVQLLKEHVHALKRAVTCLQKEKTLLERRMSESERRLSESERLRSENDEVIPVSYSDG